MQSSRPHHSGEIGGRQVAAPRINFTRCEPWPGQSPEKITTSLLLADMDDGVALDLLRLAWRQHEGTPEVQKVQRVALLYLKPHAHGEVSG